MTILYPTGAKSSRRFGAGLLASRPSVRAFDRSVADEAWFAADSACRDAEGRLFEQLAGEAEALSRMENGWYSA